ncbi:WD40-repeat-containing domain protein [Kickxella alabastrina]|uniref:WD40-repeat-containing domain protein n=1 Tax=Kickxella alabastrina TaxID=61397 RepID=UPI00221FF343|nr:WD40-repeat-containing domain protein [Kickxella alabastrina]KAI7833991.1 WD40-repeat-containing domain protein [Kickxella alabastrina]
MDALSAVSAARLSHLPVTAAEFLTDSLLLTGSGTALTIYNTHTHTVQSKLIRALPSFQRIHGIIVQKRGSPHTTHPTVLVFGSKSWSVITVGTADGSAAIVQSQHTMHDWIKAAHWVLDEASGRWLVALAFAHNDVVVYDPESGAEEWRAQCEEHCILYAAALYGRTVAEMQVASGTVFNQVLIWKPQWITSSSSSSGASTDSPVIWRLRGHEGVVFGLCFSHDSRRIASVSDDRTVRLWDLENGTAVSALFGHQARIWTCLLLDHLIVSASEDGTCRVWSNQGILVDAWTQAKKNVWALATNPSQTLVASGAADGSVRIWRVCEAGGRLIDADGLFAEPMPAQEEYLAGARATEHIRGLALLGGSGGLLAVMDSGCVLRKDAGAGWRVWARVPEGYAMVAGSVSGQLAAVGQRDGCVMLVCPAWGDSPRVARLHSSAVRHLTIVAPPVNELGDDLYDLITVDSNHQAVWSRVRLGGGQPAWSVVATFGMPENADFSAAAVSLALGWAAVGSAKGALYIYDVPTDLIECPVDEYDVDRNGVAHLDVAVCWASAHDKFTVSSLLIHQLPPSANDNCDYGDDQGARKRCVLVTGGRDGMMQRFVLEIAHTVRTSGDSKHERTGPLANQPDNDQNRRTAVVSRISSQRLTAGWVEQLVLFGANEIHAVTFYRKHMDLIDPNGLKLLSIACAGGNKQWHLTRTSENHIRCAFLKKLQLLTYKLLPPPNHTLADCSSCYLTPGISSLDIRSITAMGNLIALGGEDCVVRVYEYANNALHLRAQARRHGSAIRCVTFVTPHCLLSAGGNSELRCWSLDGSSLLESAVAPTESSDSLRIMQLTLIPHGNHSEYTLVAAAYSDASIRLWKLDPLNGFTCVASDKQHTHAHCVLSLAVLSYGDSTVLLSGATDGQVILWDVSVYTRPTPSLSRTGDLGPPICVLPGIHQSGVNTIDVKHLADSRALLASGGDDNSLTVCELDLSITGLNVDENVDVVVRRATYACAHASSVQGVAFMSDGGVCSVATDQRVAKWAVSVDREELSIELEDMGFTQVADPSAMSVVRLDNVDVCLVAGIGIEAIDI